MDSTHLKNISQIRAFPQVGMKINKCVKPPPRQGHVTLPGWVIFQIFGSKGATLPTKKPPKDRKISFTAAGSVSFNVGSCRSTNFDRISKGEKPPGVNFWSFVTWLTTVWSLASRWFQPKNIGQIGSFPQIGMNVKNIWNHHPAGYYPSLPNICSSFGLLGLGF